MVEVRYDIRDQLGRGGMGAVFRAFDNKRGHELALKRLSIERFDTEPELARATVLFEREYYTLSQLAHPNIIQAYDYGLDDSGPFYTMELLSGGNLRTQTPLPWADACRCLRDIASALAIVHSRRLVHRDVTPLNVHCTSEGLSKLIDFGAMVPMGGVSQVVGTPPYIAPECLQQHTIDAQADLFALGASLYYALTGQNAYPARSLAGLRRVWAQRLTPPSKLNPSIPRALDELVLSLLSLQASERPRSAAEVHERLTAVANLPRREHSQTAIAYLTKPALVGRTAELASIRRDVELAAAGGGTALLVRAASGMGRSRLLDAAALEAQLRGLSIARADAAEGPSAALAVARRLLRCLVDEDAELARTLEAQPLAELLSGDANALLQRVGRERVLQDLNELFLRACKDQPYAVIVDDIHDIDAPSLAFLVGLSLQSRSQKLLLVTSLDSSAPAEAAAPLVQASREVPLPSLTAADCRDLLASLFGDVQNVDLLTTLCERVCEGQPQLVMDAAQRLVDRGLVRYADASWWLSSDLEALRSALSGMGEIEAELARLSPDARTLLDVLSLDENAILSFADCPALLAELERERVHRAFDELIAARWLQVLTDRAAFRRDDRRRAVAQLLSPERRRQLHARLAERCAQLPLSKIYVAHHAFSAGQPTLAIEAMDEFWRMTESAPQNEILRSAIATSTFETAAALPPTPSAHPALQAHHAVGAIMNSLYRGLPERIALRLAPTAAALAPFSGVADYAELSHLPEPERLKEALTRAHARCEQPGRGGLDNVFRALKREGQLGIGAAVTASRMADPGLIPAIHDLRPFSALAPALSLVVRVIDALCRLTRGQLWVGWDAMQEIYTDLKGPLGAQLDPLTTIALTRVTAGSLCGLNAEHATADALRWIELCEPLMADAAESHRAHYYLAHGDLAAAEAARRRFEVLSAQAGSLADMRLLGLPSYLEVYALSDDLMGLRRTQHALQQATLARPRWRCRAELARAHVLHRQGASDRALATIERSLQRIASEGTEWEPSAAMQLELLNAAERHADSLQLGEAYLARAGAESIPDARLRLALARSHAELGHAEAAEAQLATAREALERRGAGGVVMIQLHEIGARLALCRRDRARFNERLGAWARALQTGTFPGLFARHSALLRDARALGLAADGGMELELREADSGIELENLRKLGREPIEDSVFYHRLLELLLVQAGATGGVLYANLNGRPDVVARAGASAIEGELDETVSKLWALPSTADDMTTSPTAESEADSGLRGGSGHAATPHMLEHLRNGQRRIEGIAVLDLAGNPRLETASLVRFAAIMAERLQLRAEEETQLDEAN
ncbi:MAG TPA: protein kinase [Polyangiales bacterium]|nr:protein kinase [Polyangiales bacterium]